MEVPCRWRGSAIEVPLNSVEVPLKCKHPTANSHSHRPSPANSPTIHSTLVQNRTFLQSREKTDPFFLPKEGSREVPGKSMRLLHKYYISLSIHLDLGKFVVRLNTHMKEVLSKTWKDLSLLLF